MTAPTSYAYDADVHCPACTNERFAGITDGNADEYRDSEGNAPTPIYSWNDEADCPQHCAECGEFLENALTSNGVEYVREAIEGSDETSIARTVWLPFYALPHQLENQS